MPSYKLTYFDITGLGEALQILMNYGGIDYQEERVTFDEWAKLKPKMKMEQLPILEIDGKVYHQSRAIGRYLAKKVRIYGANDLEDMEVDAAVDDIEDWRLAVTRYLYEEDLMYRAKLRNTCEEKIPFFLSKLEERVKKNGGYFVGNKLTWADIHFVGEAEFVPNFLKQENMLQSYPALKKLYDNVRAIPKIKAYLDKRPKTEM